MSEEEELMQMLSHAALPPPRGRHPIELCLSYVRDLGPGDMEILLNPPPLGSEIAPLTKLRNIHHQLAKLLAAGKSAVEVSAITGYSPTWISSLQRDPSFKELLEYYRNQIDEIFVNVQERLAALCVSSIEELQDRLNNDPESFSHKELMTAIEITGDRSVAPSKAASKIPMAQAPGGVVLNVQFVEPKEREAPIIEGTIVRE